MTSKPVALITGASSGIGTQVALELLKAGYSVCGAARRADRMQSIVDAGGIALALDLTDDKSIEQCVGAVIQQQGRLDVLVNNAGYGAYGSVEEVPLDEARRQFEVNLFGLARITQLTIPEMRKQKSGHIFNVTSIGGKIYTPLGAWYHATKHAVEGWSDALRMELEQFGIHVVIIEPGAIKTEWSEIARTSLLETSGHGVYKQMAEAFSRTLENAGAKGSPPTVVADVIVKALAAKRPKTRYAMGSGAKTALFGRSILSDRGFDRAIRKALFK
jgi:short-subunit dehydrogenase